jgi:hypothetical protein
VLSALANGSRDRLGAGGKNTLRPSVVRAFFAVNNSWRAGTLGLRRRRSFGLGLAGSVRQVVGVVLREVQVRLDAVHRPSGGLLVVVQTEIVRDAVLLDRGGSLVAPAVAGDAGVFRAALRRAAAVGVVPAVSAVAQVGPAVVEIIVVYVIADDMLGSSRWGGAYSTVPQGSRSRSPHSTKNIRVIRCSAWIALPRIHESQQQPVLFFRTEHHGPEANTLAG